MHNPFLLKNLTSQGFQYILFKNSEQKKEYTETAGKNPAKSVTQLKTGAGSYVPSAAKPNNSVPKSETVLYQTVRTNTFSSPSSAQTPKFPAQASVRRNAEPSMQTAKQAEPEKNPLCQPVLPFHAWPEAWKQIHKRCQLPSERPKNLSKQIVWTYAGLEYDLFTDTPSAKRRELIAQIIKTLSFPKGTHIFLPYRIINRDGSSETALQHAGNADYSFFWSAVDFIRPRVLVVFGQQSIEELHLPPLLPTQKHTILPVTVYALDNIMLYAENAKENEIMMNFLKTNLKPFA